MGIVWGLATSFAIGFADLFARRIVNARGALVAAVPLQAIAIVTSLVAVGIVPSTFASRDLVLGLVSGVGMGVGMWGYLGGLQRSSATVVAPIVATLSAVVPYAYALVRGASPTAWGLLGAAVAVAGLVVVTADRSTAGEHDPEHEAARLERTERRRVGIRWALVSGLGYGVGLSVVLDAGPDAGSWPAVGQRLSACSLILVACLVGGSSPVPPRGLRGAALIAGILTGLSTVFYLLGVEADPTSAVVTASIFPAISVLVGRVWYGDEVTNRQAAGIAVVLVGIVAVATG